MTAAFRSRSPTSPQDWQAKIRSDRVRPGFRQPQSEQVFELGYQRSATQKFQLALMNGQKIQMKTTESAPDELTEDETAASVANRTQDAGGLQHTIHILEGVAADGKNWIRRIESACYSRNSHIMQNSSGR